jgi:hypothetical protein
MNCVVGACSHVIMFPDPQFGVSQLLAFKICCEVVPAIFYSEKLS